MNTTSPPIEDPLRWSRRNLRLIALLCTFLMLLMWLRLETRRPDSGRLPSNIDVVVFHIAGLRADALSTKDLASSLGLDRDQLLFWPQAFAQSSVALHSSLSMLQGDLALDLDRSPGPESLVPRLRDAGYQTLLVTDSSALHKRTAALFDQAALSPDTKNLLENVERLWAESSQPGPRFLMLDLNVSGQPLHARTTEAVALRHAYAERIEDLSGVLAQLAQLTAPNNAGQLTVLLGASGLELGEHPQQTETPFDPHLHVPFVMGLRQATGLPIGRQPGLVQSADLAPTLLDLLDLRTQQQRTRDQAQRLGRSLEASCHGWSEGPVHQVLYLAGPNHLVARTPDWKLISAVTPPWQMERSSAHLYSLAEDPQEHSNLLSTGPMGPVAEKLYSGLNGWLSSPTVLAKGSQESRP
ncbi:MAG: hypothetical protein CMP23_14055 [Rickettsiales bacterium]|nr:hypothetical protein [Rickettsiales bacterium]